MIKLHAKNTSDKNVYFCTHISFLLNEMHIKLPLKMHKTLLFEETNAMEKNQTTCLHNNKKNNFTLMVHEHDRDQLNCLKFVLIYYMYTIKYYLSVV